LNVITAKTSRSQLKRAERAIRTIREKCGVSSETADALQELVEVIRNAEGRLAVLEGKGSLRRTAEMELPNRRS